MLIAIIHIVAYKVYL